jgi:hypothetical protein
VCKYTSANWLWQMRPTLIFRVNSYQQNFPKYGVFLCSAHVNWYYLLNLATKVVVLCYTYSPCFKSTLDKFHQHCLNPEKKCYWRCVGFRESGFSSMHGIYHARNHYVSSGFNPHAISKIWWHIMIFGSTDHDVRNTVEQR